MGEELVLLPRRQSEWLVLYWKLGEGGEWQQGSWFLAGVSSDWSAGLIHYWWLVDWFQRMWSSYGWKSSGVLAVFGQPGRRGKRR
jgi:hypothetical protein